MSASCDVSFFDQMETNGALVLAVFVLGAVGGASLGFRCSDRIGSGFAARCRHLEEGVRFRLSYERNDADLKCRKVVNSECSVRHSSK